MFVDGPDDKLDDETLDLVARVFSGGAGGPLEGLGGLLDRLVNAPAQGGEPNDAQARVRRSIDVTGGGAGEMSVRVTPRDGPPLVDVAARALTGESGVPMQIGESAFSRTLGAPATLGVTGRFNLSVPGLDPDRPGGLDLQSRSATTGRFAYDSTQAGGGDGGGVVTAVVVTAVAVATGADPAVGGAAASAGPGRHGSSFRIRPTGRPCSSD